MENFCISVDWLQTFCHAAPISEGEFRSRSYIFRVKKENHETAQFKSVYSVEYNGHLAATIQQEPRTSVINPKATCVKLSNRVLYSERYIDILYAIHETFGMQYKGITRLDLCYDCNRLHDGRNVERFIRQYISNEPMMKGHIIRNGSARFALHGTRSKTSVAALNSIRWGSPKSKIGAYCYDKTQELIEVKDKPWIREMWERNGIVYAWDENRLRAMSDRERADKIEHEGLAEMVKQRVWRFEISIKSQGTDILNMRTGELFKLSPMYLEHYDNIVRLFHIYAAKVFDFRINTGQKRIENYKRLQLFEIADKVTCKPVSVSTAADTGRMEKICYNKLQKLAREYSNIADYRSEGLKSAMEFLLELSGKKRSIIDLQKRTQYLNALYGYKFTNFEDNLYFHAIEQCSAAKKDLDFSPDDLYKVVYGSVPLSELEANNRFMESCVCMDRLYVPEEFIW